MSSIKEDREEEGKTKLSKQTWKQHKRQAHEEETAGERVDVEYKRCACLRKPCWTKRKKLMICAKVKTAEINWTSRGWKDSWDHRDWLFTRAALRCML